MFGDFYSKILQSNHGSHYQNPQATINDVDNAQGYIDPFTLGTYEHKDLHKRSRKELYSTYKVMGKDPTISACLSLLTTASLGGHETKGDVIFITPSEQLMKDKHNDLRYKIERESKYLSELLNNVVFALVRQAIQYGDGYLRMYGEKGHGLVYLLCNEYTESPQFQAYEQGGRTIGYHVQEIDTHGQIYLTKLTNYQVARMKMQRVAPVPQIRNHYYPIGRVLAGNDLNALPIVASEVGGSFLQDAEDAWRQVILNMSALNSQQIADSVLQSFITINMSEMNENGREQYRASVIKMLQDTKDNIKNALSGGEALFQRFYHVLPTWGEKQVLSSLGDIAQRTSPISTEYLMIHLRRMTGALGIDISMTGWADMLSGGLGDGVSFNTSAQIAQKSVIVRRALTECLNHIIAMHMGYKYGMVFKHGQYAWQIKFYSDISASSQEALENKNVRANTLMTVSQSIAQLREAGLDENSNRHLLSDILGLDDENAIEISRALARKPQEELGQDNHQDTFDEPVQDNENAGDDDET